MADIYVAILKNEPRSKYKGLESFMVPKKIYYIGLINSICRGKVLKLINGQLGTESNIWIWIFSRVQDFTVVVNLI